MATMRLACAVALLCWSAGTTPVSAQRHEARAVRLDADAVVVDGRLNDPVWQRAEWQAGFVQRDPVEGAPPLKRRPSRSPTTTTRSG